MFSMRKYLWCLTSLFVAAGAAVIYTADSVDIIVLILVVCASAGLILRAIFGAAKHSQKQYEVLLSRMGKFHMADGAKFQKHDDMLSQLDAAVRKGQPSVAMLMDQPERPEQPEQSERPWGRVIPDATKARAASELKFRALDDLAAIRALLENPRPASSVEVGPELGLTRHE